MDNLGRSVEAGEVANKGGWNCFQIVTKPGEGNFYKNDKSFFHQIPLGIHLEVDERVDGGVGHRQPEEGEEDVLGARVSPRVLAKHRFYFISRVEDQGTMTIFSSEDRQGLRLIHRSSLMGWLPYMIILPYITIYDDSFRRSLTTW